MTGDRATTPSFGSYLESMTPERLSRDAVLVVFEAMAEGERSASSLASITGMSSSQRFDLERLVRRGQDAHRRVVEANLPLVVTIAKRYWFEGIFLDDLVQAGNLGLLAAVKSYDPKRALTFSTWATYPIKNSLHEFLASNQHPVRLPRDIHDRVMSERRHGASVDNTSPGQVAARQAFSIDVDLHGVCIAELLEEDDRVEQLVEAADQRRVLLELISQIDQRGQLIIIERYGLDGSEPIGVVEQAKRRGLSRESIRLQHRAALNELKRFAVGRDLGD